MNQNFQTNEYDALIAKMRRKSRWALAFTIVGVLVTLFLCLPAQVVILNKPVVDYEGVNPVITVLLVLLVLFLGLIAYAFAISPMTTAMDMECDPQKHLILNEAFNKPRNMDTIYASDLFYMGNFEAALYYANKMADDSNPKKILFGLFHRARCEFFLGNFDSLKATVGQYQAVLNNTKNLNQKARDTFNKGLKIMNMLAALSEEDKEAISRLDDIEAWVDSKAARGFTDYLKGVAAYTLENKSEAIYRFMSVRENCKKTFLSEKSQQYLSNLNA